MGLCDLPHRGNKENKKLCGLLKCAIALRPRRQCFPSSWAPILNYLSSLISHWRKLSRLWAIRHLCHVTVVIKPTGEHVFISWVLTLSLWGAGPPTSSAVSSRNECECGPAPTADFPSRLRLSVNDLQPDLLKPDNLWGASLKILNARQARCTLLPFSKKHGEIQGLIINGGPHWSPGQVWPLYSTVNGR